MPQRDFRFVPRARRIATVVCVFVLAALMTTAARAQLLQRAVGGVSISPEGILDSAQTGDLAALSRMRAEALQGIPAPLGQKAALRKVSLRRLEQAIQQCAREGRELPDAVKYLAGLQQIRYVFVYPEQNDIVLVGPGEGWKVGPQGAIVGVTTGRPVMLLDDLLVALRSAQQAARGGISCSIDPTSEGLEQLRAHVARLTTIGNPQATAAGIERALGPQQISVTGVPAVTHFARVLVAADYRMKRIAMGFEASPVRGLPSFLQMVGAGGRGMSNMLPRWWLEPSYEPILRDAEGLAWELRGGTVKAMTEEDFLSATGNREHTGNANPVAQRWADMMTEKYPELAAADPVFGQLRNCMDLAVVAALVVKERLPEKAGSSLSVLLDSDVVKNDQFAAPKTVASRASLMKKGRNWVITASGGVLVDSWAIADHFEQGEAPAATRTAAAPAETASWWWD